MIRLDETFGFSAPRLSDPPPSPVNMLSPPNVTPHWCVTLHGCHSPLTCHPPLTNATPSRALHGFSEVLGLCGQSPCFFCPRWLVYRWGSSRLGEGNSQKCHKTQIYIFWAFSWKHRFWKQILGFIQFEILAYFRLKIWICWIWLDPPCSWQRIAWVHVFPSPGSYCHPEVPLDPHEGVHFTSAAPIWASYIHLQGRLS